MTDMDELAAKLKEAAGKATPGEWKDAGDDVDDDQNDPFIYVYLPQGAEHAISVLFDADWGRTEDAAYIVLAQPRNFTRLLEEREQLKKANAELLAALKESGAAINRLVSQKPVRDLDEIVERNLQLIRDAEASQ